MNGPQRTAVSRKELWQKRKQVEFLIIFVSSISSPSQPWQKTVGFAAHFPAKTICRIRLQ